MAVHNLPHAAARFVNRVSELAEITNRLKNADCRLLTLLGPGGIGKTRLAIRVAANCAEQFDDGVYFVPLQHLDSSEFIVSAIIDVVSFQFRPGGDQKQQLFQYLREKVLLVVLDNFEHVLDGAELLTELLAVAPDIKLLVTSREVVNLQEEWLYSVHGLQYPETNDAEQPEAYSAVQLFVERAQQVRGDLSLTDEQSAIIRVCQLVQGMPLALELAAAWTKTLAPKEIAAEIQRNLDFLSTTLRNVPPRHQSMQAVFEQSWQRLADEEQRVFGALSVFSGGFHREAAQAVAGVSMRILSDFVDKSLLTREPNGRYQIHELLRQYAQERLETTPQEVIRIRDLHAAYFAHFLHEREKDLNGGRQRDASIEIENDLDNIRAAWSWAVADARVENIEQAIHPLFQFYAIQSRLREGTDAFEKAVQTLDNSGTHAEVLLAKALGDLGWMYLRRLALEQAKVALERSRLLYSQHALLPALGRGWDPRVSLGVTYIRLGNFSAAETLGREALLDHTLREDRINLAMAYALLAMAARVQGRYEEARRHAQQGYACTVTTGDEFIEAFCLYEWGTASQLLGDLDDAKRRLQASQAIREEFGDAKGTTDTLNSLGRIALLEGENAEARRYYEQTLPLCQGMGDQLGLAISLEGMGNSACAMGHYGEARRYLREALQITSDRLLPRIPSIFVGIGELFLQTGQRARGIELLAFALHHPAIDFYMRERAQRLLSHYQTTSEAAQRTFAKEEFEDVATLLLDELLIGEDRRLTRANSQAHGMLVEPLSERESTVLTLVADGLSNREIGNKLFLAVATVKWYLTHIYSKLGVQSRTLAILRARQLGLIP